jgi:branched-chain amino acid transport system ATP-binding protein
MAMPIRIAKGMIVHMISAVVLWCIAGVAALEIATTLAVDPALMLLDEPTQGMGHEDVERVTELIAKVGQNRTILMVEHNMKVVAKIAHTITVLQRGQVIAEGPYSQVSQDPLVLEAYMGTPTQALEGAHGH